LLISLGLVVAYSALLYFLTTYVLPSLGLS